MKAHWSASSSSSFGPPKIYDVFLSFGGWDGDTKFAYRLADELSNVGLSTLMSFEGSKTGGGIDYNTKYLSDIKEKEIPKSRHFVVLLTKDYVTSMNCLKELSKIMKYKSEDYKEVIPVFYQDPWCLLKHLEDHVVKRLEDYKVIKEERIKTKFAERFSKSSSTLNNSGFHSTDLPLNLKLLLPNNPNLLSELDEYERKLLMEVQQWKSALKGITHLLTTIFVTEISFESDIINEVKEVINDLKKSSNLVGMSPQLHQMDNLLDLGSNDIRFIGIVGMGGIGKTTIAKTLYKNLEPEFSHNRCFVKVYNQTLASMQNQLLLRLGGKLDTSIENYDHRAQLIKNCLRSKKVLIVLDGVHERIEIEALTGSPDWLRPGSRIIFTTRNRNLCRQPKYKHKTFEYNVQFLDHDSSFTLFCNHAFADHKPRNFKILTEEFVKMVEGHPLALITIGSHLHGKDREIWEENIKNIDKLLYKNLFYATSYEGLDRESQQIFLDLACFFNNGMSVNRVIEILESLGYKSTYTKLHLLAERDLIQISYENVKMHPFILCMGQGIARCERAIQTRIWLREDIRRVFHEENGLKYVEGIVLMDMEEEELILEGKSFTNMTELKLLEINNVKINEEIPFLSNKLRLLNWRGYPSKCLPSTFQPPSLRELHLRNSQVVSLWEGKMEFSWLKEIDVSGSEYLIETPDFSKTPNLQRLILRNCARLCVVHPSITTLNCLVLVDMEGCANLKTIPSNLITCKKLQTLILSNSGLDCFPEFEKSTKSLIELHLDGTLIKDLPFSLGLLTHLALLNLRDCTQLSSLPRSIRRLISLQTLNLNGCKSLHQIPFTLGAIQSLTMLDIGGTLIDQAPHAITSLRNLETLNCERLSRNIWRSLTDDLVGNDNGVLPLRDLNLSDCNLEDEDIPDDMKCLCLLEILDLSKNSFVQLKQSLTQLTNLKALYLNDCINIDPKLLPKLPTSLQYVEGQNSQYHMPQNDEGSYGSESASSPSNPLRMITEIENVYDDEKEEYSPEGVDIINMNKMEKQISQSSSTHYSKFEVSERDFIGMKGQLEEVHALVDLKKSNEVRFVLICGMAGIGKTTIAQIVYNEIVDKFQCSCFLHISQKNNLVSLQHQLLSQLRLKDDIEVRDEDSRAHMIKNQMKSKMALIVLDDIDEKRQVEVLVGSPDWFGQGSRVIITTRNRDILRQMNYKDKIREYNVKLLSQENANWLFCKYAFGSYYDGLVKEELCTEIVKKVGRLPLALILIGSALHGKDEAILKETLTNLCNVEEDFFNTIAKKRNQKDCTMNSKMFSLIQKDVHRIFTDEHEGKYRNLSSGGISDEAIEFSAKIKQVEVEWRNQELSNRMDLKEFGGILEEKSLRVDKIDKIGKRHEKREKTQEQSKQ